MSTQGPPTSHEAEFWIQVEPEFIGREDPKVRDIFGGRR